MTNEEKLIEAIENVLMKYGSPDFLDALYAAERVVNEVKNKRCAV